MPTWIVVGAGTGGTSATFGRYANTYYDGWIAAQGFDLAPHRAAMDRFLNTGVFSPPE